MDSSNNLGNESPSSNENSQGNVNNINQNTVNDISKATVNNGINAGISNGVVTGGASVSGDNNTNFTGNLEVKSPPKKGFFGRFKKIGVVPLVVVAVILLVSGSAAAYFGIIKPNDPEYLWDKAFANSAKGLEKISDYQANMPESKGLKFKGSFNGEIQQVAVDGNFEGKTYESNSEIKADIGAVGSRLNVEMLTNMPANAKNPDIYFRVKGLESLSALVGNNAEIKNALDAVNNQWYVVDHTLLDQVASSTTGGNSASLTPEEITKLTEVISSTTMEYVFSTDPSKAVINKSENVGAEEKDGRSTYHYKASLNKDNFKKYLEALKSNIKGLNIKSLEDVDTIFDNLIKSVDGIQQGEATTDMWVDKKTKLIRTIKFNRNGSSAEITLNYDGGDVIPLNLKFISSESGSKSEMNAGVSLDTKSNITKANVSISDDTNNNINFEVEVQPNNEALQLSIPTDAKSINELISSLMNLGQVPSGMNTLGVFDILSQ